MDKTIENLKTYNENNISPSTQKCRGFWGCLGYVTSVAGADILGAATGVVAVKEAGVALNVATGGTAGTAVMVGAGVIVGAGASYTAARTYDSSYVKDSVRYGKLRITLPTNFIGFANNGIEHNNVIHNYFYSGVPLTGYYSQFSSDHQKLLTSTIVANAQNFVNQQSATYATNGFNYRTFSQSLVQNKNISANVKLIFDLFMDKYVTCQTNQEIEDTVNYYINQVNASVSLTATDKQALISGLMVASESPYYFLDN